MTAAQIFQTPEEAEHVDKMVRESAQDQRLEEIARQAEKEVARQRELAKVRERFVLGSMNVDSEDEDAADGGGPLEWVKVKRDVRHSQNWAHASAENLQELDIRVVRRQLNKENLRRLTKMTSQSPSDSMSALVKSQMPAQGHGST